MRKLLVLSLLALVALPAYAQDSFIDGAAYEEYDILGHRGMTAPSVSDSGQSRMYFDSTDNTLKLSNNGGAYADIATGSTGYTNLTSFVDQTAWRVFYSDINGDVTELALGADNTYLRSNGAAAAPTFTTPAGSGDFLADGTVDMTGNFNINTQAIEDANSNELLTFITEASAVNNIQVTNGATGSSVRLSAVGGDANIDIHLEPKGIGTIRLEETLPSTAGQSLAEMLFDIDSSAQVSTSEFHAILVETTGTPAGEVVALATVGKVDVIHQHIATLATPDQNEFAGKKHTGGTAWIDGNTGGGAENLDGFEIFVANSDTISFGSASQFDEIEIIMGTAATKNVNVTWWYSTGALTWTQFFPEDGTDGFQQSGDVIWLLSGITGLWTGNGDPGGADTTAGYWIEARRTGNPDPGTPTPTTIKIGLATTYFLDKTGALDVLSVEGDTLTEGGKAVLLADGTRVMTGALTTSHGSIFANATASGILTLGGTGGTYDENLTFDFDYFTNEVYLSSSSGTGRLIFGIIPQVLDDTDILLGGGNDVALRYNVTQAKDSLQLGLTVGNDQFSGYFSIMEKADIGHANRAPLATTANPTLRIYSSDETVATDYIEFFHNGTDAYIQSGTGTINFNDDNLTTTGAVEGATLTEGGVAVLTVAGGTMTGDIQLGETDIKLDAALSGDATWSGITIAGTSGVTTLAVGDLCYLNANDGRWELVDANLSDGYDKQLGICVLVGADGAATEMLVYGKVRAATFPAFTLGSPLHISETAGDMTHTAPVTTDAATRIIGIAITAEDLMFNPSNDYYTHT